MATPPGGAAPPTASPPSPAIARLQRLREVLREAWRNLASGTTRPLLALLAFTLVAGGIGVALARGQVGVARDAVVWQRQGSAISVITLEGHIDGRQCDALAGTPGVRASGAVRPAAALRLAALPSVPVATFEITPGLADLLGRTGPGPVGPAPVGPDEPAAGGVLLAEDLAIVVGVTDGSLALVTDPGEGHRGWADGGQVSVAGVFPLPAGRQSSPLDYSVLLPTAPTAPFDACWAVLWPEAPEAVTLLTLTTLPTGQGPQGPTPQVRQLNTTAGIAFDAPARLAALPTVPLTVAAAGFGAVLGFGLTSARRLELASALHAGVSRSSLLIQLAAETVGWLIPALAVVVPAGLVAARHANPDPAWVAFSPALRAAVLSAISTLLGTLLAGVLIREKHLFRHFKQR